MSENLHRESFRVRPRYKRLTPLPPCLVIDQILQALINRREVSGTILENTAYLKIPEEEQHFWSPGFEVTVYKLTEKGSLIRGIIAPRPKIQSIFIFFYAVDIVLLFLGLFMGILHCLFDMETPMLWSVPAAVLLWFLIYIATQFGRFKARAQTRQLWLFLDEAIDRGEDAALK